MPRGRVVLLGILIALFSVILTAAVFVVIIPALSLGGRSPSAGGADRTGGESREVPFDANQTLQIVVAVQRLPRGFLIPADAYKNAVDVRNWPAAAVPHDAIVVDPGQDPAEVIREQVEGQITRTDIEVETPIKRSDLTTDMTQLARVGSDIAAQMPQGMEAIAIPVDLLSSVAGGARPGDRVDLILSFVVLDVDEEFQSALPNWIYQVQYAEDGQNTTATVLPIDGAALGRIDTITPNSLANIVPSEPQRPRLVSQRAILNALVLAVGEVPPDAALAADSVERSPDSPTPTSPAPQVMVIGVTPQEAVVITWAINAHVNINVAIRSVQDVPNTATSAVTLQYIFETYGVPVPPRLPYSLEPSLRDAPTAPASEPTP